MLFKNTISFILAVLLFTLFFNSFGQKAAQNLQLTGDYQTNDKTSFAKVYLLPAAIYQVNIVKSLTSMDAPVAQLTGVKTGELLNISGDGWSGKIENGKLSIVKSGEKLEMIHFYRSSPTMNAPLPKGAIALFDGKSLDALSKVKEKEWLEGSGPVDNWKILPGNILEVEPHATGLYESVVTKQKFGDLKLHVEFRLLGGVTNGGVYLMSRYEVNIKDAYSQVKGGPIAFGNITKPANIEPKINVAFPTFEWQTLDIDFRAPRFDASGTKKTENARFTVVHNGVTIYNDVAIEEVKGSGSKLGEAGVGPIYFQEHGSAYQFRNIWVVDKTLKGTETFRTTGVPVIAINSNTKEKSVSIKTETVPADTIVKKKGSKKSGGKKIASIDSTAVVTSAIPTRKPHNKGGGKKNTSITATEDVTGLAKAIRADTTVVIKSASKSGGKKGGSKKSAENTINNITKYPGGKSIEASYETEMNPAYAAVIVVLTEDKSGKPVKTAGFIHPGILVNRAQLEEIRKRVAAGMEPQKSAFDKLKSSPIGAINYKANPVEIVSCGPKSNPDIGCKVEQADCAAAYSQALLWVITGNKVYAENAINIMNVWSKTLTGGHNYANGPVQAAWCGSVWPRAAEIMRCTYNGWSETDIAKFQNMLRVQYLPTIIHGDCENGNKELAMSEALINIGVFNDDRAVFDLGLKMWRGRTPAYIYLKTDGPKPLNPPGCGTAIWGNKGFMPEFVDGILQETARDSHHAWLAFSSMANGAETARQQGVDLYGEQGTRMMAALEFEAQYLKPNNVPAPANLTFGLQDTWEIAYNHFHNRMGFSLPKMGAVIPTNRPTGVNHHMVWETLTHGEMGSIGLPPLNEKK
jgi:hypothetical protein